MKNKLIIFFMFALVVVLATVTWQSLSGFEGVSSHKFSTAAINGQKGEYKVETKERDIKGDAVKQPAESALNTLISSGQTDTQIQASKENIIDPKLCDLVGAYDDWQKSSTGYTSQNLIEDIRGWGDRRGYFEMEYNGSQMEIKKTSDYDYYETEDLKQMADAGDSIANVKMAYRLFLKGDKTSLEQAQPYCERAIVDGYSAMNGCVITYLNTLLVDYESQEEPDLDRIRELQVESQAWQAMYGLRNDPLGEILFPSHDTSMEAIDIKDEEVEQRAQEIYRDLVKQRNNLGLGLFEESSAPDIIVYVVNNGANENDIAQCFEQSSL